MKILTTTKPPTGGTNIKITYCSGVDFILNGAAWINCNKPLPVPNWFYQLSKFMFEK